MSIGGNSQCVAPRGQLETILALAIGNGDEFSTDGFNNRVDDRLAALLLSSNWPQITPRPFGARALTGV